MFPLSSAISMSIIPQRQQHRKPSRIAVFFAVREEQVGVAASADAW